MTEPKDQEENTQIDPALPLYTPLDVAKKFKVDPKTVARWATTGKLKQMGVQVLRTVGDHRRFYQHEIDELFRRLNPPPKNETSSDKE